MRRADKTIAGVVAVVVGVISFVYVEHAQKPATTSSQPPVAAASGETWIIGESSLQLMLDNGASLELINQAFDNSHTFIYGDTPSTRSQPSQIGVPTISFSSYTAIEQAFANGTLPGKYKAVLYDNERWAATPLVEQEHPARYEELVGRLLHEHGLTYIAAPAPDLMWAVGKPADSYEAFLNAGMAASAARYADVLDIQAQVRETNVPDFSAFVRNATAQARAANPHIKVVVGIRTNPGAQAMYAAYRATASVGDGYWLNVNGLPAPAVYLLRQLYGEN